MEEELNERERSMAGAYQQPPDFEANLTLRRRVAAEPEGYEPRRHDETGVDEEEAQYSSGLHTAEDAIRKLGQNSVSADVVRRALQAIESRMELEDEVENSGLKSERDG